MSRVLDIAQGIAFVVTDLHGEAQPYARYRDRFLTLHAQGRADTLIFLGDIIHGYAEPEDDSSLDMILDIIRLQEELGKQAVVMLLGNHEIPHIYGITLSKGSFEFTPRFEHALDEHRQSIITFFKSLPFAIRTPGGVMLTHAGAAASVTVPEVAGQILAFSHDALLDEADRLIARQDVLDLMQAFMSITADEYDRLAHYHLAVTGEHDPRYYDLLRGLIVSNLREWQPLWDFLFNRCEAGLGVSFYRHVLARYLEVYSSEGWQQRVLVTGHMAVDKGFAVVADQQLRIASWSHSVPKEAGCYLLFDVAQPIESAHDLVPFVQRIL